MSSSNGTGRTPASLSVAQAVIEEEVLAHWQLWRDWLTLSREQLELQEQVATDDNAIFDLDEAHGAARLRAIEARLTAIPAPARAEFQSVYDTRRQEIALALERTAAGRPGGDDVFAAERAAFAELIQRCTEGGEVPLNGTVYELDTRTLNQVPGADRFALGGRASGPANRATILGVVAMALLIGAYIVLTQPRTPATAAAPAAPAVLVENLPAPAPRPLALALGGETPGAAETPILPVAYDRWPRPPDDASAAAWRAGTAWPIELCLPRAQLDPAATELRLVSAGTTPTRRYRLRVQAAGPLPASLVLRDCGGDDRLTRYGSVAEVVAPVAAALGDAQALPGGAAITLESVAVTGPSQDATLPSDRVRVVLTARGDVGGDWSALRPTLLLATGEEAALSDTPAPDPDGSVELTYLVGMYARPLAVAWQVSDLATDRLTRWRLTLPPPPSRLAYLDQTLRVDPPQVTPTGPGQLRLTLPLHNTGAEALTIRADDLALWQGEQQGEQPVPAPALDPAEATLAAGAHGALTLDLVLPDPNAGVTLALGRAVYAIGR